MSWTLSNITTGRGGKPDFAPLWLREYIMLFPSCNSFFFSRNISSTIVCLWRVFGFNASGHCRLAYNHYALAHVYNLKFQIFKWKWKCMHAILLCITTFVPFNNRNPARAYTYTSTWKSKTPIAANARAQGCDLACWSQKVTLSSKAIGLQCNVGTKVKHDISEQDCRMPYHFSA